MRNFNIWKLTFIEAYKTDCYTEARKGDTEVHRVLKISAKLCDFSV